jgi:hypothetical protein
MKTTFNVAAGGIIIVLLLIIALQSQCSNRIAPGKSETYRRVDTVYRDSIVLVHDTPILTGTKPQAIPVYYKPSGNYDSLLAQYKELAGLYFAKNFYADTITQDSSSVVIHDTTHGNGIVGRGVTFRLRYPVITKTEITKTTLPPARQLYIGGGVAGGVKLDVLQVEAGLLYKNRRENIIGIAASADTRGDVYVKVQYYWKIRLRNQ